MKTKLFLLSLLMMLGFTTSYAQSSAEQAGIAVQGIARDGNNTAIINKTIPFTFELYYLNASNIETPISTETKNLQTDAFGIFSYIIDPKAVNNGKFANYQAYLRIKTGTDIISNEKLNHVPYAISANNGVPTGAIMPFIGTVAPYGWALCDGSPLPSTATELIAMVGANTPNLRGMFLRGAGDDGRPETETVNLKTIQADDLKSHLHGPGTLETDNPGDHTHENGTYKYLLQQNGYNTPASLDNSNDEPDVKNKAPMKSAGNHTHKITGLTGLTGNTVETRPINYGVNYIIKL